VPIQKAACKCKANDLDLSRSGGSLEPAAKRLSEAGSAPLHAEADGPKTALGLGATYMDERAAKSSRQLSYAEVGAVYAVLVAGKPVKGSSARVDILALPPSKHGASKEGKGGKDVKSRKTPPETKSPRGEDTTVSPTAGGHLVAHPAPPNKPTGPIKPTSKGSCNVSVPAASIEATKRRTSSDPFGEVYGPLSDAPVSITATKWESKSLPQGKDEIKPRCMCLE